MRYSDELLATKEEQKAKAARQFKRGLITEHEYGRLIGDAAVLEYEFSLPTTKRTSIDELQVQWWGIDEGYWESIREMMQAGDELWCWDTINGLQGTRGIWLVRGDMVIYEKMLTKA